MLLGGLNSERNNGQESEEGMAGDHINISWPLNLNSSGSPRFCSQAVLCSRIKQKKPELELSMAGVPMFRKI